LLESYNQEIELYTEKEVSRNVDDIRSVNASLTQLTTNLENAKKEHEVSCFGNILAHLSLEGAIKLILVPFYWSWHALFAY